MKKLDIDNWFFRAMALVGDWVVLSLLWLIGCVPVITAGASTLALFAVANKMAAGQDYFVGRDFCKAFKRDFRQATAVWLPMLVLALLLVLDGWYGGRIPAPWGGLLRGAAVVAALVWALALSWGLALLARIGWVGVDLFFVISGFVIGKAAMEGAQGNAPGWRRNFAERRLRRALPLWCSWRGIIR